MTGVSDPRPTPPHPTTRSLRDVGARLGCALLVLATACGGAEPARRPAYVSRMVFAPPEVDDNAVELPGARRGSPRRARPPSARRAQPPPSDPEIPAPPCANAPKPPSQSHGRATGGRLEDGCLLPRRGRGYVRRNRAGYGTDDMVAFVAWAAGEVARIYPKTAPVVVGALARPGGGKLRGHRSHQNGRDVDIGYFASNNRALPHFRRMHHGNIDVAKSWSLIGALLATGRVQYVFMDYELQVLFYRYLEDEGLDATTLGQIFQYPAGRRARRGVVRHAKGHADHFHVRFTCGRSDPHGCQ